MSVVDDKDKEMTRWAIKNGFHRKDAMNDRKDLKSVKAWDRKGRVLSLSCY